MSACDENYVQPAHYSTQDWDGLHSTRQYGGRRKHFEVKDSLKTMEGGPLPITGRKHFEPTYGVPRYSKSSLKIFSEKYESLKEKPIKPHGGIRDIPHIPLRPKFKQKPQKSVAEQNQAQFATMNHLQIMRRSSEFSIAERESMDMVALPQTKLAPLRSEPRKKKKGLLVDLVDKGKVPKLLLELQLKQDDKKETMKRRALYTMKLSETKKPKLTEQLHLKSLGHAPKTTVQIFPPSVSSLFLTLALSF